MFRFLLSGSNSFTSLFQIVDIIHWLGSYYCSTAYHNCQSKWIYCFPSSMLFPSFSSKAKVPRFGYNWPLRAIDIQPFSSDITMIRASLTSGLGQGLRGAETQDRGLPVLKYVGLTEVRHLLFEFLNPG